MGRIFLSYARKDYASARCLARVLEDAAHTVWWDRQIESGHEFSAEIEAELENADLILVAWSTESVKSRWVRDEAAVGGDSGRLVPVTIDGSRPPMGFRQFQTLDLTGWKGRRSDERTGRLLHAVQRRLNDKLEISSTAVAIRSKAALPVFAFRRSWAIACAIMLLIAGGGILYFKARGPRGALLKPTIALVPFTSAAADPDLRSIASQAGDSLAHSFSASGVPLKLISSAPNDVQTADFTISGDVVRNADKVTATVKLDDVAHGMTVFSHRFEVLAADAQDLPERIGAQMAGNLTWAAPLMVLDRRHALDPSLMADLLQTYDFTGDPLQGYQNAQRVAAKAPDVAIAQISFAFDTSFILDQIPRAERADAVKKARVAAERAIALRPDFGDTYGAWCLLNSEAALAECEDRVRAGRRIDPDAPFLNSFLSQLLRSVGRFDEAVELTRLSYSHDLYVPTKIGWMLRMLEYTGDRQDARDLYQPAVRWWPEFQGNFFRQRLWGLIDRGDFEGMAALEDEIDPKALSTNYQRSAPLAAAMKSRSVATAQRACQADGALWLMSRCMLALATLGDLDGAYTIAAKLYPERVGRTGAETEGIWLEYPDFTPTEFITSPAAAPLRRDARYLGLAQRTGLLAYWRAGRPPDFCRKQREPICRKLLGH